MGRYDDITGKNDFEKWYELGYIKGKEEGIKEYKDFVLSSFSSFVDNVLDEEINKEYNMSLVYYKEKIQNFFVYYPHTKRSMESYRNE